MATSDDVKAFFEQFAPIAQKNESLTGVKASVTLGQAAQESGYGKNAPGYNFFGVKAYDGWTGESQWLMTKEEVNGVMLSQLARFKKYQNADESFADHAATLQNDRYKLVHQTTNPYEQVNEIRRAGYATDSGYADSVKSIIKDNNLTAYDKDRGLNMLNGYKPYEDVHLALTVGDVQIKPPKVGGTGTVIGDVFGHISDKSPQDAYNRHDALNPPASVSGLATTVMTSGTKVLVIIVIIAVIVLAGIMMLPKDDIMSVAAKGVKALV